jgi:hypothetical protein
MEEGHGRLSHRTHPVSSRRQMSADGGGPLFSQPQTP